MSKLLRHILGGQHGQAFAMTLIVVAVTAALSIPLLSFLSSVLHRSSHANVILKEQYSADAGAEDALWNLSKDPTFSGTYTISANQGDATVNVAPYVPVSPPPPPPPPVAPNPGHEPLMWTTYPAGVASSGGVCAPSPSQSVKYFNLSLGATPTQLPLTICIGDTGQSQTGVSDIIDVLPSGFTFVQGSVVGTNLVYKTNKQCGQPGGHCSGDPFPLGDPNVSTTPLWSFTGPDPYQQPANCTHYHTTNQTSTQQKLEWGPWSSTDIPKVDNGKIASISFNLSPATLQPGMYRDDPWINITQNQCTQGSGLQAGMPSWILAYKTLRVTVTQGGTTLTVLVEVMPPNPVKIISLQY